MNRLTHAERSFLALLIGFLLFVTMSAAHAQAVAEGPVSRVDLPIGRSFPVNTPANVTRISVANPEVADAVAVGERDVVINARTGGETDIIIWSADAQRRHYRVMVRPAGDRQQILLSVKFAEVRRDLLTQIGLGGAARDQQGRVRGGAGIFNTGPANTGGALPPIPPTTGFGPTGYLTILTNFGTNSLLGFLEAQEQTGNSRTLAEPSIMAANKEEAAFLAGGEIPIPVAATGTAGAIQVTIAWKEFGVRLNFLGEIVNDSLLKLKVRPEVSSLDYANAITLQGFRIPALRTRRLESTMDVRRNQSLVISGLFNDERERVRVGIPYLSQIPILGALFGSTRWQRNETELLVVVTPMVIDPNRPRPADVVPLRPEDRGPPAREAIDPRLREGALPSAPPRRP